MSNIGVCCSETGTLDASRLSRVAGPQWTKSQDPLCPAIGYFHSTSARGFDVIASANVHLALQGWSPESARQLSWPRGATSVNGPGVQILQVPFNEGVSICQHPRGKVAVSIQRRLMQAGRLALVTTKKCNCGGDNQLAVRIHYYLCVVIWSEPILTCSRDAALGFHEVALALELRGDRRGICQCFHAGPSPRSRPAGPLPSAKAHNSSPSVCWHALPLQRRPVLTWTVAPDWQERWVK